MVRLTETKVRQYETMSRHRLSAHATEKSSISFLSVQTMTGFMK